MGAASGSRASFASSGSAWARAPSVGFFGVPAWGRRLGGRARPGSSSSSTGEGVVACDFFTLETVWLRTLYVLFLSSSRQDGSASRSTSRPDSAWVTQQAWNLAIIGRLEDKHVLLRDRDAKFSQGFDEVLRTEALAVVRSPIRAPKANAFAERWVGSVRRECLDHVLVLGRRHLQRVLGAYVEHYNRGRPHRGLDLQPPDPGLDSGAMPGTKVRRRDVLGGLIHEYHRSAA